MVIAGVPMRMPLVTKGFCGSFGMAFLLTVMWAQAQRRFGFLAGEVLGAQIDQEHVGLGAPGNDAQAALLQHLGHHAGVVDHLLLVLLEFLASPLP